MLGSKKIFISAKVYQELKFKLNMAEIKSIKESVSMQDYLIQFRLDLLVSG